jgi:AbrB family looped-hinge helix DNA binding protein
MAEIHIATVKVIKDGRVTIPLEIRELADIKIGDYLKITIEKIEKQPSVEGRSAK